MTDLERQLAELDEALRFSAKTEGWIEPDTSATGLLPEDEIQSTGNIEADFKLDQLPDAMRFVGWARHEVTETEVTVIGPGGAMGSWPRAVWEELVHRYLQAG